MLAIMTAEQLLAIPAPIHHSHLPGNFQSSIFNRSTIRSSKKVKTNNESRWRPIRSSKKMKTNNESGHHSFLEKSENE